MIVENKRLSSTLHWLDERLPFIELIKHSTSEYPTPKNLNYWWNYGSLSLFMLVVMILTGLFLAMNYVPHTTLAFDSVEHIMRDVNYGWLLRYLHSNGASFFFILVYIHMFRGLYYGSYKTPREVLWWLGLLIYLLMMATGFLGYTLPWGQMSLWGATVITDFFSAIPLVGEQLTTTVRGSFAVGQPTLNRFFALHFLLPFVIVAVVILHIYALHKSKSNNPIGIEIKDVRDTIPFHPYYTIKDMYGVAVLLIVYCFFVFWAPNFFGEPDNYIEANSLQTPSHILPEWYFLPFYAILRSVESKLGGIVLMFGAIVILVFLPFLDKSPIRSATFRPLYKIAFWMFFFICMLLGYLGRLDPDLSFLGLSWVTNKTIGMLSTLYYFSHFLVVLPILSKIEKPLELPQSIASYIEKKQQKPEV